MSAHLPSAGRPRYEHQELSRPLSLDFHTSCGSSWPERKAGGTRIGCCCAETLSLSSVRLSLDMSDDIGPKVRKFEK
jgi:hypothetical protein